MLVKTGPSAISQQIKHPELLTCLRTWHGGHLQRDGTGAKITLPWRTLELQHIESNTTICSIDVDADEDDDKLGATIEHKIEMFCKPRSRGDTQLVDVICHFNDGMFAYSERCTIDIDIPPNKPAYGHTGYAGMGRDLSSAQTQQAVMLKGNIDLHHATMGALREAMTALKETNNVQRQELADHRAHQGEMFKSQIDMIKAFREITDMKIEEELKRELHKYKIFALHAAFNKVMTYGPPVVARISKAIQHRIEGHDGSNPLPPRERRALSILKDVMNDMQKSGAAKDPAILLQVLKGLGVDEVTADRLLELAQEFQIEEMTEKLEAEARQGLGAIFAADGTLQIPGFGTFKTETTVKDAEPA